MKKEFSLIKAYSTVKIKLVLIECFEYLSKIDGEKTDELFVKYYENIECKYKELDIIVNEYFSKK